MKNLFKLLTLTLIFTSASLFSGYTLVHDQMDEKIKSPSLQNIKRQKIRLDNGLEAYLVSDPQAKKSGASLSVGIGWNHEPYKYIGLAHFVEHMLFMGTEKYPIEKEYHEFMKNRGGHNNAYTSHDQTVYAFDIANEHAMEALDRFASFFISPLFNESSLDRERQAVNQEYLYRANLDYLRMHMVSCNLLNEKSNSHVWRCGNTETLKNVSRKEMVEWYQNHYSSNLMRLVVYSSLPMETLLKQVDQCFSPIKNKNIKVADTKLPLSNPEYLGKTVYVKPNQDQKRMAISWEMPEDFATDLDCHTAELVTNALGEEATKSLSSQLKEMGLINGLGCRLHNYDRNVAFFEMVFELTEPGLQNRDQIVAMTYAAIHALQKSGIPRYRFDELNALAKLNYQFQSRPDVYEYVESSAAQMQYESLETFPKKSLWPSKYDAHRTASFLAALKPDQAVYFVMAPGEYVEQTFDLHEKISKVPYSIENIEETQLTAWSNIDLNHQFAVSTPNPYIPSHLEIVTKSTDYNASGHPATIHSTDKMEICFMADQDYQVPEVNYTLFLQSPTLASNAKETVLKDFYLFSLTDKLSAHLDQGSLAGLRSSISYSRKFGCQIAISGYSQKAQLFLKQMIQEAKNHQPQEKDFYRYKDFLGRSYQNQMKKPPVTQAGETMNSILIKDYNTTEVCYEALASIDYEQFQTYCQNLFDAVYIRAMIYGNVNQKQAKQFVSDLEDAFERSKPYSKFDHQQIAILDLNETASPRYFTKFTDQAGSSTKLMISHGQLNHQEHAAFAVLSKAISSPFYDTLRTKQQVGYIVATIPTELEQKCFTALVAQSNSCTTRDMLARFELFNEQFLASIGGSELGQSQFETIKNSIIDSYQQPPVSISDKAAELATLAFEYQDYNWKEKRIEALKALTFEEFTAFCFKNLGKQNSRRIAVLIDGDMSSTPTLSYMPIQNITLFKAENSYYPKVEFPEAENEL